LQAEIDRQGRIDELLETVKTGKAAKRRLDAINAELDKARRVVGEAQEKSDDLAAKHEVEWRMMSDAVRAANEAAVTLTKPEYLTPEQRDTLAALEKKCHAASIAIADAQQAIPIIKDLIETADRDLARMAAEWAPQGRINSARRTVDARRERLRTAEETVGTRQREIDDAAKQRDAIYEEIRRAAGG
jgi:hypothetical protein